MQTEHKKCLHCGERFTPWNGNAQYCCEEHYKAAKKLRQKKIHTLTKEFKKGFYNNFKLFTKLLPNNGNISMPLLKAKEKGFDEKSFYGISKDTQGWDWYGVSEYWFTIKSASGDLFIYKKN